MVCGRQTKTTKLAEKFRNELQEERLPKDSPVMSVRELAEHFSISTVTANRILNLLVDQDILYRKPQSGTFVKHEPPVVPAIAYAGPLPEPGSMDPIKYDATFRLLEHFAEKKLTPKLISYHALLLPALARQGLRKTNGLLVDTAFLDEVTLKNLRNYDGKIVVTGNAYIENRLSCSQVIPDFTEALLEFDRFSRFADYDKILILSAEHWNSRAGAEMVRRVLDRLNIPEKKMETVSLKTYGNTDASMRACQYFSQCGGLPENTLIISQSEYFSQAVREVFSHREKMPDILNIDNMEDYRKDLDNAPYFTSIDCRIGAAACRALDLLCGQLENPKQEQTILQIPAELVIRKSVKRGSAVKKYPVSLKTAHHFKINNFNLQEDV